MTTQIKSPSIESIIQENDSIIDNIKILIYKENPTLFELLDFKNENLFKEPLLFAYFNAKEKSSTLEQILFGYIVDESSPPHISVYSDENGRIYLPHYGWLLTKKINKKFDLQTINNEIKLLLNNEDANFIFDKIRFIKKSSFELVHYQHPLFTSHYYDVKGRIVAVEVENITRDNIEHLNNAIKILAKVAPSYYKELSAVICKMVIFNDPTLKRNSFATLSVHGCLFFNAYQADYNEIFFIEDIAHQGAHVIFNTIASNNKKKYFKVDSETYLTDKGFIGWMMNRFEKRTLFVLMHALHTYYAILICLDGYLDVEIDSTNKRYEALGRLGHTIHKFKFDLKIIDRKDKEGNNLYLAYRGIELLDLYKETYKKIVKKRGRQTASLKFGNQPYNFTYSKFVELNPFKKNQC
jgi:hypothetical protein